MTQVTELTPEQIADMPKHVEEALQPLLTGAPLDRVKAEIGIDNLYAIAGLAKPTKMFVCSPKAAQIAANLVTRVPKSQSIEFEQIEAQVNQSWRTIETAGFTYFPSSDYGSYSADAGWINFCLFFRKHNLAKIENEKFDQLAKFLTANLFSTIILDGVCICCEMPSSISRDDEHRLHSTTGKAIEWRDGWGFHALWGLRFSAALWQSITSKTIAPKDVLSLDNIEQRMAALRFLGLEYIFDSLPSNVLHKSERGNTLFSIDNLTDETEYALRYLCPSTQRQYVSFVPPEIGKKKDADLAMAWKHNMTLEMYRAMELES